MTWTYSGIPSASNIDKIRFLVGDVDINAQLVSDEEILWSLTQFGNHFLVAALVCRSAAAKFLCDVDCKIGDISVSSSQKSDAMIKKAKDLEAQAANQARLLVTPFVGGISISEKEKLCSNDDAVGSNFSVGMDDRPGTSVKSCGHRRPVFGCC